MYMIRIRILRFGSHVRSHNYETFSAPLPKLILWPPPPHYKHQEYCDSPPKIDSKIFVQIFLYRKVVYYLLWSTLMQHLCLDIKHLMGNHISTQENHVLVEYQCRLTCRLTWVGHISYHWHPRVSNADCGHMCPPNLVPPAAHPPVLISSILL